MIRKFHEILAKLETLREFSGSFLLLIDNFMRMLVTNHPEMLEGRDFRNVAVCLIYYACRALKIE